MALPPMNATAKVLERGETTELSATGRAVGMAAPGSYPHLGDFKTVLALPWDRGSAVSVRARAGDLNAAGFAAMNVDTRPAFRLIKSRRPSASTLATRRNRARALARLPTAEPKWPRAPQALLEWCPKILSLADEIAQPLLVMSLGSTDSATWAAAVRLVTSSFSKMDRRWACTVRGLSTSLSAMSALLRPSATSRRTSTSRDVSPDGGS